MNRTGLWLALGVALLLQACGASIARPTSSAPTSARAPESPAEPTETSTAADSAPAVRPGGGTLDDRMVATCAYQVPRSQGPTGPVLAASGAVTVWDGAIAIDGEPDGEAYSVVCHATRPLPAGSRLVVYLNEYDEMAALWDGSSVRYFWETDEAGEGAESGDDEASGTSPLPVSVMPGQEITVAREMQYCPTDPSHPCMALGSYDVLSTLSALDPHGPRSGWDFTESPIAIAPASQDGTRLTGEVCGLSVRVRRSPRQSRCSATEMDARLQCMVGESFDLMDAGDPDDPQDAAIMAAQAQTRLVVSDGTREIELPGHQVVRFLCVDGTALALEASAPFGSRRSFAAIDLSRGRIRAARRMAIVDHEEASSQCANAWDGVDLVPIVGAGVLVGGVVRGALASPRFDVGRGDVGDVEGLADSESALLAYRVAGTSLEAIAEGDARAAVCSTRVADDDGETNVRPDPSTRRPPVGALPNGTVLRTVEQRGRWYRIEQPVAGWVWSEGLERRCR